MPESRSGTVELRAALAESRALIWMCALFSVFVNALMLTGPLFMLQVYDRVLASRSEETLVALVLITAFLFLMMGILDHARSRVLARAGARFERRLEPRVLKATLTRSLGRPARAHSAVADLGAIARFASSPGAFAFFDAPWTPVFLAVLYLFHPLLGLFALGAGCVLLVLALVNQVRTARLQREAADDAVRAERLVEELRAGAETVAGLGMRDAVLARTARLRDALLARTLALSDRGGLFGVTSKTLRLFLQSMILGLGAWLAIRGELTFGAIIAASILLGRALAPLDQALGQWVLLQRVLEARRSLAALLAAVPAELPRTALPVPRARFEVSGLTVIPPGAVAPVVRGASLRVGPGEAVGIGGASASGKSTLARALAGVWVPVTGAVRLDGATLDQYGETLGQHVGYLPQDVVLFEGSVAANIARFAPGARAEDVVEAAKRAGAHDMILTLPGGYDFEVGPGGRALSGGQRQRTALARALYGSPVLLILDEPDAHLDAEGALALARALETHLAQGGAAVIFAHRRGVMPRCGRVYAMADGRPCALDAQDGASRVRRLGSGARVFTLGRDVPEGGTS